ncbi:hypothetical protein CDD81_3794 [Ophiocordyceps australis]|uniref:NAD(P)-binding domain-containing protein n=1 Tax=Ophiocordyceps australis TaxID=1399860 RepID=A0A2C5X748_9HYPO|nr:hypothetical protein CDD81_3794 [Ophiocordyceps australis]
MASQQQLGIVFLGATGGCGLSALRRALDQGHECIALCRKRERLEQHFCSGQQEAEASRLPHKLVIRQGDAHDWAAVASCLRRPSNGGLVDAVCFSIGGSVSPWTLGMEEPHVCRKGIEALVKALKTQRDTAGLSSWRPLVVMVSTTGISAHGRDVPLALVPLYRLLLHAPHRDKREAEAQAQSSGERLVLVRPSLLVNGSADWAVRVHLEGPAGVERREIGYTISREAVGAWIYECLLAQAAQGSEYEGKAVGLTW